MSVGSFGRTLTPGPDSRKAKLLLLVMGHVLPKEARPRRSPPGRRSLRLLWQPMSTPAGTSSTGCQAGPLQTQPRRPIGLVLGRWLWTLCAEELYAVPLASVPTVPIVAVGVGALVVANVVALPAARHAARVPTPLVLRAE